MEPEIDPSNGWEAIAGSFIESSVGVATIRSWSESLPKGCTILDVGCGPGGPRSEVLVCGGFSVYGVDASPSLAEAYRVRFPNAQVACETVEESRFFGRTFDAAIAWGLLFLLPVENQRKAFRKIARALKTGGRFLFTAPARPCTWADFSTGRPSHSLGAAAYNAELAKVGVTVVGECDDEGENHYYEAVKM